MREFIRALICALAVAPGVAVCANADDALFDLPLADLGKIQITSVAKRAQPAETAAAAIFVLSNDDIRRSGATSIPEALRLVPGLHVAQSNSHSWAISARGFNSEFANKLLVLIDGRTVYSPVDSGTFWDQVDVVLQDIDRIEVIRGPGATVWGVNAVNGVINIITKHTKDSQGALVSAGSGTEMPVNSTVRYGGALGDAGHYRVYAKGATRSSSERFDNSDNYDSWRTLQGGSRVDLQPTASDALMLQSDVEVGKESTEVAFPFLDPSFERDVRQYGRMSTYDLHGQWNHTVSPDSEFTLQAFVSRTKRDLIPVNFSSESYDLGLQHNYRLAPGQTLTWGIGYRHINNALDNNVEGQIGGRFEPRDDHDDLVNGFVQDEVVLIPDRLTVTLGTKVDHSQNENFGIEPGLRVAYTPTASQTVWASVGRALRIPSTTELNYTSIVSGFLAPDGTPTFVTIEGNKNTRSEELTAYELGYRVSPIPSIHLDIAAFYNHYTRLIGAKLGDAQFETEPFPHVMLPEIFANNIYADQYGIEGLATWHPLPNWQLQTGYSYDCINGASLISSQNPRNQLFLRSLYTVDNRFEIDPIFRYVDSLPGLGLHPQTQFDLHLGYRINPQLRFSIFGHNLFKEHSREWIEPNLGITPSQFNRSVIGVIDWTF